MSEINIKKLLFFILCMIIYQNVTGHREHKVHNIVLYPDKHSWCTTLAIKQVISYPGCHSAEIDNNVCVGACFSYSIPHTEPSDPGEVIVPYCDSCQPSETKWHHVTLQCNGDENSNLSHLNEKHVDLVEKMNLTKVMTTTAGGGGDNNGYTSTHQLVKRVQIITNCSCSSCESTKNRPSGSIPNIDIGDLNNYYNDINHMSDNQENDNQNDDGNGNDGSDDDIDGQSEQQQQQQQQHNQQDIPDLLNVLKSPRSDINTSTDAVQSLRNNHKLILLLQNIQEKNSKYDKAQLMEVLRLLQSDDNDDNGNMNSISGGKKLSDKSIAEFVESLNTEHIELDMIKLREVLKKLENSHIFAKHRKYGLGGSDSLSHDEHQNDEDNDDDNDSEKGSNDDEENHQQISHVGDGIEGNHHGLGHLKGVHIGLGLHNKVFTQNDDKTNNNKHQNNHHTHNVHNHYHHHHHHHHQQQQQQQQKNHHIGEKISHLGHLTRGPHGALVIQPDNNDKINNNESNINHNNNNNEKHVEKLNVNPYELKPNHAGTLMSYTSHHGKMEKHNDNIGDHINVANNNDDNDENDDITDSDGDHVNMDSIIKENFFINNSESGSDNNSSSSSSSNTSTNNTDNIIQNISHNNKNNNNRNNHNNDHIDDIDD